MLMWAAPCVCWRRWFVTELPWYGCCQPGIAGNNLLADCRRSGASTVPSSSIHTARDPEEYERSVRGGDLSVVVTEPGQFAASTTRIDLHRLWMQRSSISLSTILHTHIWKVRSGIYFRTDSKQASMAHCGVPLSPGDIVAVSPSAEQHHRMPSDCHWGAMTLTPEDLAANALALTGREPVPPVVSRMVRPDPMLGARLLSLHEAAGHLAATAPDLLAHPEVARAIEQELVRAMIACLTDPATIEPRRLPRQQLAIMRRFESLLEERQGEPLYMTEVCAAIGVTDRTLRLYCHEHLGMSPHRYLWLRRMQQARRALSFADGEGTTVTAIANDHGFAELGRFAVTYRDLFGESPSATLRRPPDEVAAPKSRRRGDPFADPA